MSLKLLTAPSNLAVSLTEAKAFLGVDFGDDDTLINRLIVAAIKGVESHCQRALITQAWRQTWTTEDWLTRSRSDRLYLALPPLQSVTSVKERREGADETIASTVYAVSVEDGLLRLRAGQYWPLHDDTMGYLVEFTAGYGTSSTNVPDDIRQVICDLVADCYLHRGATAIGVSAVQLTDRGKAVLDDGGYTVKDF